MGEIKDKRLELLIEEVNIFLNNDQLFEHCLAVAKTAEALTEELTDSNERRSQAFIAGLLHDIGGIYPNDQRVEKAEIFNIELLTEEREFPLIIHQKLSKYLASQHFKITDEQVLSAIECHTTLRKNFTELDLIVFLADKISWDGVDNAPFRQGLLTALSVNLQSAALYYINFIIADGLKVAHPWLLEAKKDLENQLS